MPKNIIDYSNTIIYKIVCNNLDIKDVYVGHTTHFIKRKQRHKRCCTIPESNHYNLKVYQVIRENGNWDNWSMIEIEKYKCNDRNEAIARERYWYESLNSTMNTNYPSRSHKEYLQTHKQEIAEKSKIYNEIYYEQHREEILHKHKEYGKINKGNIQKRNRNYREKHNEEIKFNKGALHTCVCGINYTHSHKTRHEKTKKHQEFVNQNITE